MQPILVIILLFGFAMPFNTFAAPDDQGEEHDLKQQQDGDTVILLHGLGRSKKSMRKIEKALMAKGFYVVNIDYPSTTITAQEACKKFLEPTIEKAQKRGRTIHFVTHSLGGIIVRYYLKNHHVPMLGRTVMLTPPNHGSEIADFLKDRWIFKKVMGPAGQQLGTADESLPNQLGPVAFDLGVIAGDSSYNPLFSKLLQGPDDGIVSVESTAVQGMKDTIIMPYSHTFIMMRPPVIEQIISFLDTGKFIRP